MTARETQQKAAEYLSKYRIAKAEVGDIQNRIAQVRAEMMSVRGISYEGGDIYIMRRDHYECQECRKLQQAAQRRYEIDHTREEFIELVGKSYL